jgi:hypothetical protein
VSPPLIPTFDNKPRVPERFNELSKLYQVKVESIMQSNLPKPSEQIIETQFAKEERDAAELAMKNFKVYQDKSLIISNIDTKAIRPYIRLTALKDFEEKHEQIMPQGNSGTNSTA